MSASVSNLQFVGQDASSPQGPKYLNEQTVRALCLGNRGKRFGTVPGRATSMLML